MQSTNQYKSSIYHAVCTANRFLSTLYRAGLWLKPSETSAVLLQVRVSVVSECSEYAFRNEKTRFKPPPKFHAFAHIVHSFVEQIRKLPPDILQKNDASVKRLECFGTELPTR